MEFRTLRADEIDVRVGNCDKAGYTLLLYKDARCDMNILDETVGSDNWQRDHKEIKGNLYCGVAIWNEHKQQWVWKWDCGTESFTEKEKGEASDSFKRACVNVGIGRELYTTPKIKVYCQMQEENKRYVLPKEEKYRNFIVKEIGYNDKREIVHLVVVDDKGEQVYPSQNKNYRKVEMTEEFVMPVGKHKGKHFNEISAEYLDWFLEKCQDDGLKNQIIKYRQSKGGNE